jgi:Tfp pilus assembly protein PilN
VYLCGGTTGTPHLREFFEEKLQLPVEFFNPLRNIALSKAIDSAELARSAHVLGEVTGLALRSATTCPIELNLRPRSVVRRQEMERRRPFLMAAAACLILSLLAWGAYFWRATAVENRATTHLQEKVDALRRIETQMNEVRKQTATLDSESTPLVAAIHDRSFWPLVLEDLNARLPKEDIWITELVPTSGGKQLLGVESHEIVAIPTRKSRKPAIDGLVVRGLYLFNAKQQEVVVDYFRNLIGSPWFAIDPNNQAKVIKPTTPNSSEWAFPYELRLDLKRPVPLP